MKSTNRAQSGRNSAKKIPTNDRATSKGSNPQTLSQTSDYGTKAYLRKGSSLKNQNAKQSASNQNSKKSVVSRQTNNSRQSAQTVNSKKSMVEPQKKVSEIKVEDEPMTPQVEQKQEIEQDKCYQNQEQLVIESQQENLNIKEDQMKPQDSVIKIPEQIDESNLIEKEIYEQIQIVDQPKPIDIVNPQYGDQKIDIGEILQKNQDEDIVENKQYQEGPLTFDDQDPSRPTQIPASHIRPDEPLPSYSNKVNMQEFTVGHYKEYHLREELCNLIEKYNKKFNPSSIKPAIQRDEVFNDSHKPGEKAQRYNQTIINPMAVPNPAAAKDNYSWMYLMTPYYNQLVNEFNQQNYENHVLKQHFEYHMQIKKEKEQLDQDFSMLQKAENELSLQIQKIANENQIMEGKAQTMERNYTEVQPQRLKEFSDKIEYLNNVLRSKDEAIESLLNEISQAKSVKDTYQNQVLFKKQKIETHNMDFNTKEMEYQRQWEEGLDLKKEIRGETKDALMVRKENEILTREIIATRQEIQSLSSIYEGQTIKQQEAKQQVQEYEGKLRYANDIIQNLENDIHSQEIEISSKRAIVEQNNRSYNQLKSNFNLLNESQSAKDPTGLQISTASPIITMPKLQIPSTYYKPLAINQTKTINIMPSASKSLSQQVPPLNIKSYLTSSVKKATIDLTSSIAKPIFDSQKGVRFQNFDTTKMMVKRSDSADLQIPKRENLEAKFNQFEKNRNSQEEMPFQPRQTLQSQPNQRVQSVNRNFIDSIGGLMGMSDSSMNVMNSRASVTQNTFPLNKSPERSSQYNSPDRNGSQMLNSEKSKNLTHSRIYDTENSLMDNYKGTTGSQNQSPYEQLKNISRFAQGRFSQPQQVNSVTQKPQQQHKSASKQNNEEEKYRQSTWQERMEQLPKQSAYKSSITFASDGVTVSDKRNRVNEQNHYMPTSGSSIHNSPFKTIKEYEIEVNNEDDPQARNQAIKIKQQRIYELSDYRKSVKLQCQYVQLQDQMNHIPENSKQVAQRNKRAELDSELQIVTKKLSVLKYDIKKMGIPAD